jgi:hypothetical protein
MTRLLGSRKARLAAVLVTALILAGGAAAYFTSTGSGTASATASSAGQPVTISAGTPSGQLYPGGSGDVVATVSNPNPAAVRINSLALDPSQGTNGFAVDSGHSACDTSVLAFTTQTNGGNGWTAPAGGNLPITLAGAVSMGAGAANACQGATFTVYLKKGS